jgi:UDP-N-acetylglucosamine 2-epimerase (non-hydrolysing)
MKAAPVVAAFRQNGAEQTLVHTGQHYDAAMSDVFFQQLGIPAPDINLAVGSGSHAVQTAEVMTRFEPVVVERRPDLVLVYGDVNSTMAAALVCAKLGVRVGHVEAGLRSFDRTMPEEINRLVTDQLADLLFTPSEDGDKNLMREGIDAGKVHCVGNVMIDTLIKFLPVAGRVTRSDDVFDAPFALVTLHRPSNVDEPEMLGKLVRALATLSEEIRVVFPIHPRTRKRIGSLGGWSPNPNVRLVDPIGYIEFLALQMKATMVVTDSGGIQEETTYLRVPCLTVRRNTERPVTATMGTNVLVGQDTDRLLTEARRILSGDARTGHVPPLWDGRAGSRIADLVMPAAPEGQARLEEPLALQQ